MTKKDKGPIEIDVDKIKSLPVALETIEELIDEREKTENTHKNKINTLTSKIKELEKTVADALKTGAVKTGHGTSGVASQHLHVKGRS